MNRTFCTETPDLAMDQVFIVSTSCDASFPAYVAWFSLLSAIKFVTATGISLSWWQRHRSRRARTRTQGQLGGFLHRRLPVIPTVVYAQFLLYGLFTITTSVGICNSQNGCPLAVFCSLFVLGSTSASILLKQFIKLGRKVIPLARVKIVESTIISDIKSGGGFHLANSTESNELDALAKEDKALRWLFWIQHGFILAQWLAGVPLEVSQSGRDRERDLHLALGFQVGFYASNGLGFFMQLQRLITATTLGCEKPFPKDIRVAIHKMWIMQVGLTMAIIGLALFTLMVAVDVLPPYWYVVAILFTLETCCTTLSFLLFVLQTFRRKGKREQRQQRAQPIPAAVIVVLNDPVKPATGSTDELDRDNHRGAADLTPATTS